MHPTPLLDLSTFLLNIAPCIIPLWTGAAYAVDLYVNRTNTRQHILIIVISCALLFFYTLIHIKGSILFTDELIFPIPLLVMAYAYNPAVLLFQIQKPDKKLSNNPFSASIPAIRQRHHILCIGIVTLIVGMYASGIMLTPCGYLDRRLNIRGCIATIQHGNHAYITNVTLSPDTSRIAINPNDMATFTIAVYDTDSGTVTQILTAPGLTNTMNASLAWSLDSTRLAARTFDDLLIVWQLANPATPQIIKPDIGDLRAVALSPDGSHLAVVAQTGRLQVWNLEPRAQLIATMSNDATPTSLLFDPSGRYLALGATHGVIIWDVTNQQRLPAIAPGSMVESWTPAEGLVTRTDAAVSIITLTDGEHQIIATHALPTQLEQVRLTPRGEFIGIAAHYSNRIADTIVEFWNIGQTVPYYELAGAKRNYGDYDLSADGQVFAVVVSGHQQVQIWHTGR